MTAAPRERRGGRVPLGTVLREWTRIGLTGFGGPPRTSRCSLAGVLSGTANELGIALLPPCDEF
jgi:hypothetical protein